jgi:hypothetical protein
LGLFFNHKTGSNAGGGRPWGDYGRDRDCFKRHRELSYTPPAVKGHRPPLLIRAENRLSTLVSCRQPHRLPWHRAVRGIKVTPFIRYDLDGRKQGAAHVLTSLAGGPADEQQFKGATVERVRTAIQLLHKHLKGPRTKNGHVRLRRNQALHSVELVLSYLLAGVNAQPGKKGMLDFMECRRVKMADIAEATGLSLTAVATAHARLLECGYIRIMRRREKTVTGYTELPARRWLSPHLFASLGLARAYERQLAGGRAAQRQARPASTSGIPTQEQATATKKADQSTHAEARAELQKLGYLLKGQNKPPP